MPTREALTSGVLDLVLTAGPVAKAILLILALFSIVSLGLMFEKWRQFRRVRRQTLAFLKVYRDARTQALVHASARKLREKRKLEHRIWMSPGPAPQLPQLASARKDQHTHPPQHPVRPLPQQYFPQCVYRALRRHIDERSSLQR